MEFKSLPRSIDLKASVAARGTLRDPCATGSVIHSLSPARSQKLVPSYQSAFRRQGVPIHEAGALGFLDIPHWICPSNKLDEPAGKRLHLSLVRRLMFDTAALFPTMSGYGPSNSHTDPIPGMPPGRSLPLIPRSHRGQIEASLVHPYSS